MIGQGALMIALLWGLSLMKTRVGRVGHTTLCTADHEQHMHGNLHVAIELNSMDRISTRKPMHVRLPGDTPTHLPMHGERPAVEDIHTFHDKIRIPHFLG
ncbi:hypothetical protein RhiXN_10722 [Rhizoctonia solani]|nr:uncharacterized protein RhiXN_10722 [Rhizoctonia solani]QRW25646.1 hypothetical protein RhiXN_10722 [Rhizoctonia solani]